MAAEEPPPAHPPQRRPAIAVERPHRDLAGGRVLPDAREELVGRLHPPEAIERLGEPVARIDEQLAVGPGAYRLLERLRRFLELAAAEAGAPALQGFRGDAEPRARARQRARRGNRRRRTPRGRRDQRRRRHRREGHPPGPPAGPREIRWGAVWGAAPPPGPTRAGARGGAPGGRGRRR